MIRIVGLSATLPNYADVATFLGVNHDSGLFYFDASYRPVPLEMQFIGVSEKNAVAARNIQDDVCYDKVCSGHFDAPGFPLHTLGNPLDSVTCNCLVTTLAETAVTAVKIDIKS